MGENPEKKKKTFFHHSLSRKDSPFANYINILIGYADSRVLYNLFFILVSLGIVTIGPAFVARTDCFNDFIGDKTEKRYRLFFKKLKENFSLPNVLFGIILTLVEAALGYLFVFCRTNFKASTYLIVPWICTVFLQGYLAVVFAFYALRKVRRDLPTKTILKNAFILAIGGGKSSILSLFSFLILMVLPLFFFEYCFVLFILIEFSWITLSRRRSSYSLVDKYVLYNPEAIEEEEHPKEPKANLRLDLIQKTPEEIEKEEKEKK